MLKIHSFLQRVKVSASKLLPANICKDRTVMVVIAYTMITVLLLINPGYIYGTAGHYGVEPYAKAEITHDKPSDAVEETEYEAIIRTSQMKTGNELSSLTLATTGTLTGENINLNLFPEGKSNSDLILLTENTEKNDSDKHINDSTGEASSQKAGEVANNAVDTGSTVNEEQNVTATKVATENTQTTESEGTKDSEKKTTETENTSKKNSNSIDSKEKESKSKDKKKSDKTKKKKYVIDLSDKEIEILQRIVEAEATGEDTKGKMLVANVILNRVKNKSFPDTVEGVVFQRNGGTYQFSPVKDKRYWKVTVSKDTVKAVEKVLQGEDYSKGALYFSARSKADKNSMSWFDRNLEFLFRYGGHEFFK